MCVIHFGSDRADHLTVTIHGRAAAEATEWRRGNILRCTVEVRAGMFHGAMHTTIWDDGLAQFLPAVEALAARSEGSAWFEFEDTSRENAGSVCGSVSGDGAGRFEVQGHLCHPEGRLDSLKFRWPVGPTALALLAEQVRAALAAFPVIGDRPGDPGAAPDRGRS